MKRLLYTPVLDETAQRLERIVMAFGPPDSVEICRTGKGLTEWLRRPCSDPAILVLVAPTKTELEHLGTISDWLDDRRIILVLPDRERETVSQGHALRPRFLAYVDSDFLEVAAVMTKMLQTDGSLAV